MILWPNRKQFRNIFYEAQAIDRNYRLLSTDPQSAQKKIRQQVFI